MIVSLYSFKPLPLEVRSTFDLQAWPHNPEFFHLFEDYMKSFKVFRYQDNAILGRGLSSPPINFPVVKINYPFVAYYNQVAVSDKQLTVINWPADKPSKLLTKLKSNPIQSDMKAWMSWNVPVQVFEWNEDIIRREIMHEYVDATCEKGKCYGED